MYVHKHITISCYHHVQLIQAISRNGSMYLRGEVVVVKHYCMLKFTVCVAVGMKLIFTLSAPLWNLKKPVFYWACYISVHLHLPAGLSCTVDQYLNLHTVEKETTDWNLISQRAVMSRYLTIWISLNVSALLNWAQRKGPGETRGAEVNETGTFQAEMKSCFVLAGAQRSLMHIF